MTFLQRHTIHTHIFYKVTPLSVMTRTIHTAILPYLVQLTFTRPDARVVVGRSKDEHRFPPPLRGVQPDLVRRPPLRLPSLLPVVARHDRPLYPPVLVAHPALHRRPHFEPQPGAHAIVLVRGDVYCFSAVPRRLDLIGRPPAVVRPVVLAVVQPDDSARDKLVVPDVTLDGGPQREAGRDGHRAAPQVHQGARLLQPPRPLPVFGEPGEEGGRPLQVLPVAEVERHQPRLVPPVQVQHAGGVLQAELARGAFHPRDGLPHSLLHVLGSVFPLVGVAAQKSWMLERANYRKRYRPGGAGSGCARS
mmetsp:Transcript_42044/g.82459  ORF Transcript_42044/g.82459 Transcript_42044/m.82459 type:complete len:305 (+) Transcript_42044:258-1172(+)